MHVHFMYKEGMKFATLFFFGMPIMFASAGKDSWQRMKSNAKAHLLIVDMEHLCSIHIATLRVIRASTPHNASLKRQYLDLA